MTNKPTWEEELKTLCEKYCNCIDAYTGRHMLDPSCTYHHIWQDGVIENFISTKLAEQRQQFEEMIESMTDDALVLPMFRDGFNCAKTELLHKINLIKQI